jgi:hypothetical protein
LQTLQQLSKAEIMAFALGKRASGEYYDLGDGQ